MWCLWTVGEESERQNMEQRSQMLWVEAAAGLRRLLAFGSISIDLQPTKPTGPDSKFTKTPKPPKAGTRTYGHRRTRQRAGRSVHRTVASEPLDSKSVESWGRISNPPLAKLGPIIEAHAFKNPIAHAPAW